MKKRVRRKGPTTRSHCEDELPGKEDWAPSDPEDDEQLGFLGEEEDDGLEPLPFVLPNGRKSRANKQPKRVWYDETRENPEQQFRLKLCFKDVYQFRQALCQLHIAQVRNFHYHKNGPDRIIVCCKPAKKEKYNCQFFMSASKIKHESSFGVKKMHLEHCCPTEPSSNRVTSKFLSNVYVDNFRSDPNTGIRTIVDKAKKDFGVEVPKRMAYRAKTKAREKVMGDHKRQYRISRYYL